MSRFRLRIALLSLGVVFGYGSAIARHFHGPSHGHGFFCDQGAQAQGPSPRGQGTPKPALNAARHDSARPLD